MKNSPYQRIRTAIEYLYDHAREQPGLAELAAQVHLSPGHFQKLFTQYTGISPKQMLSYCNIETAKKQLAARKNLAETAFAAGLSGTGRLHDLFIKIEGMTPYEYQNGGQNLCIDYAFSGSPLGEFLVANTDKGICFMAFADERSGSLAELEKQFPNARLRAQEHPLQHKAMAFFSESPEGVRLHIKGTPFQLNVWQALLKIPAGSLCAYSDIAAEIGQPKAQRAVGSAIARNPVAVLIPCHRVIRENGMIGQYRWGRGRKIQLLAQEHAAQEHAAQEHKTPAAYRYAAS